MIHILDTYISMSCNVTHAHACQEMYFFFTQEFCDHRAGSTKIIKITLSKENFIGFVWWSFVLSYLSSIVLSPEEGGPQIYLGMIDSLHQLQGAVMQMMALHILFL